MSKDESLKEDSKWGGARDGAGRPPGGMNEDTKLRVAAEKGYKQRVVNATDKLLNAQLTIALGESYLIRIDEVKNDKGKVTKREHVLVDNPLEILAFFNEGNIDDGKVDDDYYYITTKKPDARALNDILDRTYGRAKQSVEHLGDVDAGFINLMRRLHELGKEDTESKKDNKEPVSE